MHLTRAATSVFVVGLAFCALIVMRYWDSAEAPKQSRGRSQSPRWNNHSIEEHASETRSAATENERSSAAKSPYNRSEPPDLLPPSDPIVRHCLRVMHRHVEMHDRKIADALETAERIESDTDIVAQYLAMWELDRCKLERALRIEAIEIVQRQGMIPVVGGTRASHMRPDNLTYELKLLWGAQSDEGKIVGALVPFYNRIPSVEALKAAKEEWTRALAALYADDFNLRDPVLRATMIQSGEWRREAPGAAQAYLQEIPGRDLLRVKHK